MMSNRSALRGDARSLRRMLGEKEALLIERERVIAEKETQLAERDRVIAVRDAELYAKTLQIEHLKAQLAVLRRARFGRSSEKLDREIEQLKLVLGELEEAVAESNARTEQAKQESASPVRAKPADRRPGGRKPLPAHLPRERVLHEPAPACACCGGKVLRRIGDEVTEVLECVPSSFTVIQHVRPKMSCRACETIVQAPLPSLPIERGRPGPGLLAHVAVSKCADGLPLHRQSVIYTRQGVDLDRSTMADWMGSVAALVRPLVEAIRQHVFAGRCCAPTTPRCRFWRPGWAGPRPEGYGRWCAMSGRGRERQRRRRSTATRPIAGASVPRRCSADAAASSMPTDTPVSKASTCLTPRPGLRA
jgi:transposase